MPKTVQRVVIILIVVGGALWFLSPRLFDQAANSLITSASSVSHAQGLAQFVPANVNQTKKGALQVKIDGLSPNTVYDVTLDQGQCGANGIDLGTINSDGNGSFDNSFSLANLRQDVTWFIDIHQQNAGGQSVACGQLETNATSGSQVITGPNVFGGSQSLPNDQGQNQTPTTTGTTNQPSGLPNTGADPGNNQNYDNNTYPRKY